MATENENGGAGARWVWAAVTPLILAAAVCTGIGLFFIPAVCIYLDGRSRTYAGAISLAAGMALAVYFFGAPALAVSSCVAIATAAAYILGRMKTPFSTGLTGSAAGGVLGMTALLGILGMSAGVPLSQAAASYPVGWLESMANKGDALYLNLMVYYIRLPEQANLSSLLSGAGATLPADILSMSLADKVAVVRPMFETAFAVTIPAAALAGGLLLGGLGYWLPQLALARRAKKLEKPADIEVPPFAAFRIPKYIVVSVLLVQIVASFGSSPGNIGWLTVETAAEWALGLLMNAQALALFSFLLNRRGVATGFQILIFIPAVLLFWWLLTWVGIFDALFDMRAVLPRIEEVRAKGKQVFTQDGLEELRKMEESKRNGKKDKDGEEDGKK